MKTSNKLLIAFATALIIVPILITVYVSKANYTDRKNYNSTAENNIKQLDKTTEGYFKKSLQSFNKIIIPDGANLNVQLLIINSNKYGVKIPEDFKDVITFTVNQNKELSIKFDDRLDRSANRGYGVIIVIYNPEINKIDVSKIGNLTLNAQLDSLDLKSTNTENINFGSVVTYHNIIGATHNNSYAKNLNLELEQSGFQSQNNSFNTLTINATKNSDILLQGDKDQKDKFNIKLLKLNTTGHVEFKIENMNVDNSIANVSDSTNFLAPTYILKQMFKHQ